jgi:hypothetical protein
MIEEKIFWKEGFEGICTGGIYYRTPDLRKFLEDVEEKKGEIVGLQFEDNNLNIIVNEEKKSEE